MLTSGILEFFLGNTFPFVVFCSFGKFSAEKSEYQNQQRTRLT